MNPAIQDRDSHLLEIKSPNDTIIQVVSSFLNSVPLYVSKRDEFPILELVPHGIVFRNETREELSQLTSGERAKQVASA